MSSSDLTMRPVLLEGSMDGRMEGRKKKEKGDSSSRLSFVGGSRREEVRIV